MHLDPYRQTCLRLPYAARIRPSTKTGINRYTTPPFVAASLVEKVVRWRIVALAGDGQFVGESEWREIASLPCTKSFEPGVGLVRLSSYGGSRRGFAVCPYLRCKLKVKS